MLTALEPRENPRQARRPRASGRAAVLFHLYEWDTFTERQAAALAARSRRLDFYVVADETRGVLPVKA